MYMKRTILTLFVVLSFATLLIIHSGNATALESTNSASVVTGELQVINSDINSYQNQIDQPYQIMQDVELQADQIERSQLDQYANDNDLIIGAYSYGSLQNLKLTKQQAEIIKNGYVPIIGKAGNSPIANPEKGYVEYDCGNNCSGSRGVMRCGMSPMAYDGYKTEYEVMVRGSKYGTSTGGYVCVGPKSIKNQCSVLYEQNPCLNGTLQLDTSWLLSIGLNMAEIKRQIEANKYVVPTPPPPAQPAPQPTEMPDNDQPAE